MKFVATKRKKEKGEKWYNSGMHQYEEVTKPSKAAIEKPQRSFH